MSYVITGIDMVVALQLGIRKEYKNLLENDKTMDKRLKVSLIGEMYNPNHIAAG